MQPIAESMRRGSPAGIRVVFSMLAEGSIHLTTLRILGPCLTEENHVLALEAARHKSKEELERLAATLRPQPDVPLMLRKLPGPAGKPEGAEAGLFTGGAEPGVSQVMAQAVAAEVTTALVAAPAPAPPRKAIASPLSPDRYKLQLTVDADTYRALRQLQELLRHQVPNGDMAVIVKDALLLRLEQVKRERLAQVKHPRKKDEQTSWVPAEADMEGHEAEADPEGREGGADVGPPANPRHIPAAVKRAVWKRDQGRCAFVAKNGRRCSERGRLEFHHVHAYALGGAATRENIALRCRSHNAYEGAKLFGPNGKKLSGSGASSRNTGASDPRSGTGMKARNTSVDSPAVRD